MIELEVPAALGYGNGGIPGTIPGGASLHFLVELQKIE
jgi:FKBP-type peptidyl-prolyl cis-trans isomerase